MVVLGRKQGEDVFIEGGITFSVLVVRNGRVRLGFAAPRNVRIVRSELPIVEWSVEGTAEESDGGVFAMDPQVPYRD